MGLFDLNDRQTIGALFFTVLTKEKITAFFSWNHVNHVYVEKIILGQGSNKAEFPKPFTKTKMIGGYDVVLSFTKQFSKLVKLSVYSTLNLWI